jgi:hypothetical protein
MSNLTGYQPQTARYFDLVNETLKLTGSLGNSGVGPISGSILTRITDSPANRDRAAGRDGQD